MTTNPDGDGKREAGKQQLAMEIAAILARHPEACPEAKALILEAIGGACPECSGDGCPDCSGTGLAPQFLVQHPDFKREQ